MQNLLKNEPGRISSIEVRFTSYLFPGEKMDIKVWEEGDQYFFEGWSERKTKVIQGIITLRPSPKM